MNTPVTISLENLSEFIRLRRRDLGLTQKQLGDVLGIDQRTVSALEKRPQSISVGRYFALMEALQIRITAQEIGRKKAA
ncbi:MAG: helix-turn-helix transcriptional regulator [Limnobacter sp.]|nr:helix-turn-helix transcriptional regulator [Limnobacter sp.]